MNEDDEQPLLDLRGLDVLASEDDDVNQLTAGFAAGLLASIETTLQLAYTNGMLTKSEVYAVLIHVKIALDTFADRTGIDPNADEL